MIGRKHAGDAYLMTLIIGKGVNTDSPFLQAYIALHKLEIFKFQFISPKTISCRPNTHVQEKVVQLVVVKLHELDTNSDQHTE